MFQEVQSGPWSLRRRQTEAGVVERQHLTLDRQKGNKIWRSWPGVKPRIADSHQAGGSTGLGLTHSRSLHSGPMGTDWPGDGLPGGDG